MRTDGILTGDEADELLAPFKSTLVREIRGAFADWSTLLENNPKQTAGVSELTRARYLHDRTVYRLTEAEANGNCPGLRMAKIRGGLQVAVVSDRLMLKLKKLDRQLRSRNIRTKQTVAFDTQAQLISGGFAVTNATSGYVLDAVAAEPVHIVVVCWEGNVRRWVVNLDEDTGGPMLELPAEPVEPPSGRRRTRIVAPRPETGVE